MKVNFCSNNHISLYCPSLPFSAIFCGALRINFDIETCPALKITLTENSVFVRTLFFQWSFRRIMLWSHAWHKVLWRKTRIWGRNDEKSNTRYKRNMRSWRTWYKGKHVVCVEIKWYFMPHWRCFRALACTFGYILIKYYIISAVWM